MQEDFCPPDGSLTVQEGRAIAPIINTLLANPGFVIRVASQDYHPPDHISFASNHTPPNNRPFESFVQMANPAPGKQAETKAQLLWPVHCVADTKGASIIPEIDSSKIDVHVKKGMDARVEMYSMFSDAFGNLDPTLTARSVDVDIKAVLVERNVTHVFTVGLAGDYCVKCTAIDAARAGFKSYLVEDATRCVDPGAGWEAAKQEFQAAGVSLIRSDGPEIATLVSS
ncbi:putative isochorismatase family hydrolase [Aspergillus clavatus NRRL 1]|uniref:nicotinamidase n=1 Tax=Aspergillus clavatus (strain ATCC 1007 / CBS 513.65 / DSM 816 / NCTC 3887 / NRRL 1 / QM 1276 / 107) TaxID=344612 RepID=A1CET3_ASPCL|nr:isochorismatase family hydrolase, putative [Aspergillus clavatus NRRL 1]EAW11382.1 isochorismatase family hydrolase, putative [Aspergillus clavatus NRRL 1]